MFEIQENDANGEAQTVEVGEEEFKEWIRGMAKGAMPPENIELYVENRVLHEKSKRGTINLR